MDAKALVAFTLSGTSARLLAAQRPALPILAFTPDPRVRSQLALVWGVETFLEPAPTDTDDMIAHVDRAMLELGRAEPGDAVVVVAGTPPGTEASTNTHAGPPTRPAVAPLYRARRWADPGEVQCPTCGSVAGRWRGPCGSCGERASIRAFSRLAFAEDPTTPPLRSVRPVRRSWPRRRPASSPRPSTSRCAGIALLWTGAIGTDLAFASHTSAAHQLVRALAWLAVLAAPMLMEAADGQTFGKRIVGIRVVSRETGGPIPLFVAVHRGAARALFWFITFLALGDPLIQPLHDRSAGTVVINADASGWVPPPDSAIRAH